MTFLARTCYSAGIPQADAAMVVLTQGQLKPQQSFTLHTQWLLSFQDLLVVASSPYLHFSGLQWAQPAQRLKRICVSNSAVVQVCHRQMQRWQC